MKLFAIIIMLVALYLLYRIAFPEGKEVKKGSSRVSQKNGGGTSQKTDNPSSLKKGIDISDVVVKSRFVRPVPGQPRTTRPDSLEADSQPEKPDIFAAGNEKRNAVIPPEKLDEVFTKEPSPEDLDIDPDENETDAQAQVDEEEEAEELRQALGEGTQQAGGWSIEEMEAVVEATQNPTDGKAGILYRAEKTDMFEQLISGDNGKAERISAIIERHLRGLLPEAANEDNGKNDFENFNVADFLS